MAFTSGNDVNILQGTDSAVVGAGAGNDKYILDSSQLTAGQTISISDASGANTLHLVGGLVIVSSKVSANSIQLTLNNGAVVNVDGADTFTYLTGGNSLTGVGAISQNFSSFVVSSLGLASVPTGTTVSDGAANVTVNTDGTTGTGGAVTFSLTNNATAGSVNEGSSITYTVTAAAAVAADTVFNYALSGSGSNPASAADVTTPTSGSVTIQAGSTTATFTVTTAANDGAEFAEGFTVTLTDSTGATIGTSAATINDTSTVDPTAPVVTAPSGALSYAENQVAGATLATIAATDNIAVTGFEIASGDSSGLFAIDAAGKITLTAAGLISAANDFETTPNTVTLGIKAIDAVGNKSAAVNVVLNETDADDVAPTVQGDPSLAGNTISVTFSEALQTASVPSSAFLVSQSGSSITVNQVTLNGNVATLTLASTPGTGTVTVAYTPPSSGVLEDAAGNDVAAFTKTVVADTTAPSISTFAPVDAATGVTTTSNVVLTFNENVALNSGSITLTNPNNAADTRTFTITNGAVAAGSAGTVTVSGSTVTINPTADLLTNVNYRIAVANGTFKDVAGNSFAGGGVPSGGYDFTTLAIAGGTFALTANVETLTDSVNNLGGVTGTEFLSSVNNTVNASLVNNAAGVQIASLQNGDQVVDPSTTDADVLTAQFNQAAATVVSARITNIETINVQNLGAVGPLTFSASNITGATTYGITGVGSTGVVTALSNLPSSGITVKWDVNDPLTITGLADATGDTLTVAVNSALTGGVVFTNGNASSEYDTVNLGTTTQTALDFTYTLGNAQATTLALTGNANSVVRALETVFTPVSGSAGVGGTLTDAGTGTLALFVTNDGSAAPDYTGLSTVDRIRLNFDQGVETQLMRAAQTLQIDVAQTGAATVDFVAADEVGTTTTALVNVQLNTVTAVGLTAATGIERIALSATGTSGRSTVGDVVFTTVTTDDRLIVTGSQDLTITTVTAGTAPDLIDASGYLSTSTAQGALNITVGAAALTINGSASVGGDVITGAAAVQTFNANGGYDLVNEAAGTLTVRSNATTAGNAVDMRGMDSGGDIFTYVGTLSNGTNINADSGTVIATTVALTFGANDTIISVTDTTTVADALIDNFQAAATVAAKATASSALVDAFVTIINATASRTNLTDGDKIIVSLADTTGSNQSAIYLVNGQTDGVWAASDIQLIGVTDAAFAVAADIAFATV